MVAEEQADPVVAPVFERLRKRWGRVLHLYRVLAWSPPLVKAWADFAWALRFDLDAPRRLREMMVIRIAEELGADYEYRHHLHMARDEGVTAEQIAALSGWRDADCFDERERVVLTLADDLAKRPGASAETMAALQRLFGEKHALEFVVTGSFYCGVARIINSAGVEIEPDHHGLRAKNDSA
jgi:alkylhydroperoxidase family enzyme